MQTTGVKTLLSQYILCTDYLMLYSPGTDGTTLVESNVHKQGMVLNCLKGLISSATVFFRFNNSSNMYYISKGLFI